MPKVVIYTTNVCPFCVMAKTLLNKKAIAFEEINVEKNPSLREEMMQKAGGRRTVPQIFIGEKHVGGCDDLYALEEKGELDRLINL